MIGQLFGHYRIVAPLGAGGMGEVYRAHDPRLERDVAVKVVNPTLTRDRSAVDRFVREARAASRLNHPNIVTIHDIGETGTGRFIVTELVEGRTVRDVVESRVPWATAADIIRQAALALAAAHAAGIVHRDVKPENLMVRADGLVKVLDFGLARLMPERDGDTEHVTASGTAAGIVLGTLRYMAPEQAAGGPAESAADVFALGLVMYELLTTRHAFGDEVGWGVLGAIAREAAIPASRLDPTLPAALDELLLKMLAKEPNKRPTASEVATHLEHIAGPVPAVRRELATVRAVPRPIGRGVELTMLRATFDGAASGVGQMVTVAGEPGIGKSTLIESFLGDLEREGLARVARGRCSERLAGAEAYLPWLEALDHLVQGASGSDMARALRRLAPSWYAQIAPSESAESAGAASAPRAASQERIKREAAAFLQEIASIRPLVVFIDDVHWADESTVDLLAYVAGRMPSLKLLVIATYRPSELALGGHPFGSLMLDLQSRQVCRAIGLGYLTVSDVEACLDRDFPDHQFPSELGELLHARTEGSPLFVHGLLRDLRDRALVATVDGAWRQVGDLSAIGRGLPESVRGMIERALARLDTPDRALLNVASVQGYSIDSGIVASATHEDAAHVEERLDHLERVHGLLVRIGERELPDRTLSVRYRFAHVMYQNALYDVLTPTRRAALSRVVAEALIAHHGSTTGEIATELALLFEAARDSERAAEHYLLAARRAARIFAHGEVMTLAKRGLALVGTQAEGRARNDRELNLLMVLGAALSETKGFSSPEVEPVFARARVLCEEADDPVRHFPVLHGLRDFYYTRGEKAISDGLQLQLNALATRVDNPVLRLQAHHSRWTALVSEGYFPEARACLDDGLALYDRDRYRASEYAYGHDPGVCGLVFSSLAHWALGHSDRALDDSLKARSLARELAHPSSEGQAGFYAAMLHQLRGEISEAREQADATIRLTSEQGFAFFLSHARVVFGWTRAAGGQPEQGVAEMQSAVAEMQRAGTRFLRPYCQALLADRLVALGRPEGARAVIAEGLEQSRQTGQAFAVSELYRLEGDSWVADGDDGRAETCYGQALGVARLQRSPAFEQRVALSLARITSR